MSVDIWPFVGSVFFCTGLFLLGQLPKRLWHGTLSEYKLCIRFVRKIPFQSDWYLKCSILTLNICFDVNDGKVVGLLCVWVCAWYDSYFIRLKFPLAQLNTSICHCMSTVIGSTILKDTIELKATAASTTKRWQEEINKVSVSIVGIRQIKSNRVQK